MATAHRCRRPGHHVSEDSGRHGSPSPTCLEPLGLSVPVTPGPDPSLSISCFFAGLFPETEGGGRRS